MTGRLRAVILFLLMAGHGCRTSRQPSDAGVDSLLAPGELLYREGKFEEAGALWREALARPGVSGTVAEARLLTWTGLAAMRANRYAEARRLGERAVDLAARLGARSDLPRARNALALIAWHEGRLSDAAALANDAVADSRRVADDAGIARASNTLGLAQFDLGRFDEARQAFLLTRDAGRRLGDPSMEGRALANLAMWETRAGDPAQALQFVAAARVLAEGARDVVGRASAIGQGAVALAALGRQGEALAAIDSAIGLARGAQLREEEANDLVVAATIYADAGDPDQALQAWARARQLNRELGLTIEAGTVLRDEATLRASRGAIDLARENARDALVVHREAGARLEEFLDLIVLGDVERRAGRIPEAEAVLAESRVIATELGSGSARVATALLESRIADARGDPNRLLQVLAEIEPEIARQGPGVEAEIHALRLRGWVALDRLDSAVASGRQAIEAIERVRDGFGSGTLRTSYVAERSRIYADLVLALLKQGDSDAAFAVADAARGRALLEHLSGARLQARGGSATRDLAEADRLLRRIDKLLERLAQEEAVPPRERGSAHVATSEELMRHLEHARRQYRAHLVGAAERDPASARWLGLAPAQAHEIRAALAVDELLVEYLLTADRLFVFVMSRDEIRVADHPITATQLTHQVHLARDLVSAPGPRPSEVAVTEALHQVLIDPVRMHARFSTARHLIVVAHGPLSYLPFATLRNPATRRLLVQDLAITHLPSAAALPLLRSRAAAVFAPSGAGFAPFPDQLPSTRGEVEAFQRAVPQAMVRTGARATEAAVRQALGEGRLVHIASHGILSARTPLFSRIELARGRDRVDDDGRLEVHEVMNLSIATPLVFLSGCQTGVGSSWNSGPDQGADLESLAQAFLFAGAGGVVATLWRVDDAGAAAFAERFYLHLRTLPPADALSAAQQDLRQDPRWNRPYYWGAYTLNGVGPSRNAQFTMAPAVEIGSDPIDVAVGSPEARWKAVTR